MTNKAIATAITAWCRCIILSSSEKIRRFLNLTGTCLAQVDVHVQSCANARVRLCATRLVGKKEVEYARTQNSGFAGKTNGQRHAHCWVDWGPGQPDEASDYWRRTVRELSLQCGELPRRCDYGMAYPRLRSDLGGDSRQRHGRDGAGRARDNRLRRRAYQSRRTALARRKSRFADVAYHGDDGGQQVDALGQQLS